MDLSKAGAEIEAKDAEINRLKRKALEKSKEMVVERSRYSLELKQAAHTTKNLREELATARSEVIRLEAGKIAEAEKAKRTMDHMRQIHRRDLTSKTSCISAAATESFDKFRRHMLDQNRREGKLAL